VIIFKDLKGAYFGPKFINVGLVFLITNGVVTPAHKDQRNRLRESIQSDLCLLSEIFA